MTRATPFREELNCLICEAPGPALDMAHVVSRAQDPSRKNDPSNIVPLCRRCHRMIDENLGWAHCVRDGYYEITSAGDQDYGPLFKRVAVEISPRHGCLVQRATEKEQHSATLGSLSRLLASQHAEWSPEKLALMYSDAEKLGGVGFLMRCWVCAGLRHFYDRYGQDWRSIAANTIGKRKSTVYNYSEVWEMLKAASADDIPLLEEMALLHPGTLQIAAQVSKDKRGDALAALVHRVAETGGCPPAEARRLLQTEGFLPNSRVRRYTVPQLRASFERWEWGDQEWERTVEAFLDWLEEQP